LSAGKHTITVHLIPDPNFGSEQHLTYNLTIGGQ
jgi:hypothetical protein